ncbi:MAG: protein kinase [Chlamydiales bacterium]|nr:protein kinase [Chlamydiales bacterium]
MEVSATISQVADYQQDDYFSGGFKLPSFFNLVKEILCSDSPQDRHSIDLRKRTTDWIFHEAYNRPKDELEILDVLTESYPNFSLERSLGQGSFSKAFLFSYEKGGETCHKVLKFNRFSKSKEKPEYFSLSKDHFGGEWLALLSHGDKVATTRYAIAFDNHSQKFVLINAALVQELYDYPEMRESVDLTFIGSISDYIEGSEDLKSRITKSPESLTTDVIRSIGQQLLQGVQSIHQKGIIHRDIKPGNVLINGNNEIKFIDFGCASVIGQNADNYRGSGLYAAPELQNGTPYSYKIDSYSIGMTLFELATGGKHLKSGESSLEDVEDIQLRGLITELTADDPEVRLSPEEALGHSFFTGEHLVAK